MAQRENEIPQPPQADVREKKLAYNIVKLTPENGRKIISELKDGWNDELSSAGFEQSLLDYLEQCKNVPRPFVNAEYLVAIDPENGKAMGIVGIGSEDILGTGLLLTKELPHQQDHNLTAIGGWFVVANEYKNKGIGGELARMALKMGTELGVKSISIETDDSHERAAALGMYEKMGAKQGFEIEDYFGPGRDLNLYYCNVAAEAGETKMKPSEELSVYGEEIGPVNKQEVLAVAKKVYSQPRFEEFEAVLDLILSQPPNTKQFENVRTMVKRDEQGKIVGFAVLSTSYAPNLLNIRWEACDPEVKNSRPDLMADIKGVAKENGRGMVLGYYDSPQEKMEDVGFTKAKQEIPYAFAPDIPTAYLLYSLKLEK